MDQRERLCWLIQALVAEDARYAGLTIPEDESERFMLYRSLVNVRPPRPASAEYLQVEDAYLKERARKRGIVDASELAPVRPDEPQVSLWQGDITRLATDAIVNAANSQMLGCFVPCHGCIDNAIHTAAGVRLRLACAELMDEQGAPEPTGRAKITPGFNLPARNVLHTVGPIVPDGHPSRHDQALLASCYQSCLELAHERGLSQVAFCCISTGEFGYPQRKAAKVAVDSVRSFLSEHSNMKVVFDVFSNADFGIYQELLG
ncbi:MAG: protein-ADP-ribose hydrolase [Tractidigestivibacter sp.]|jgi:O-acetyl-ADP-ribose deacetylase (regulator of RNase III)|uniref:protein-ADP-ribose hydrolase n=1 Tax=Tractidigestivibacter sp. TaxID=2847320 RepID=UPI003D94B5FD